MIYVPSRIGQLNRRALLRQLQKAGVASRAELAKSLGMSQPTAGKIVDEFIAGAVVEEVEEAGMGDAESGMRGRPGRKLRLNRAQSRFLAIHLGLQETSLSRLSLGAPDLDKWEYTFSSAANGFAPARVWEKNLRAVATKIDRTNFLGVLLSVPGIVDEAANRILFSPNLHWTEKFAFAKSVRQVFGSPVQLVQEERALALGHHLANPHCADFLLVDFGEGVGGAILVDGKLLASPLPVCGEIGHTPVLGNDRKCGCGATGCIETLVSLRGLLESFSKATRGGKTSWSQLREHISKNGIEPWLAHSLDAAATAIAGSLNVLGLRRVVVTGSLTELPPEVMAHLARAIESGAMWARFGKVECLSAPRRRLAGLLAVGIDQLVVPEQTEKPNFPRKNHD